MLSGVQRNLLGAWLPANPDGARGLLMEYMFPDLDAAGIERILHEVCEIRARFAGTPSLLVAPAPMIGQIHSVGDGSYLSYWERAWLLIDREPDTPTQLAALREHFTGDPLDTLGVFLLASPSLEVAGERVHFAATLPADAWRFEGRDRAPWVHWLAGTQPLPNTADDQAVTAALQGDWAKCSDLMPDRVKRAYPSKIRATSQDLMHGQMLRQLWMHAKTKKPSLKVLGGSLNTLFSHWGYNVRSAWHAGMNVKSRLPLLGMVARLTKQQPLELLHLQRVGIPHLIKPPPRTFTLPREVDDALETYERILATALAAGGPLKQVDVRRV